MQIRNFLLRFGNTLVRFDWLVGPRVRWWCSARRECFEEELACRSRVRLCRASQLKCGNCFFTWHVKPIKSGNASFLVAICTSNLHANQSHFVTPSYPRQASAHSHPKSPHAHPQLFKQWSQFKDTLVLLPGYCAGRCTIRGEGTTG